MHKLCHFDQHKDLNLTRPFKEQFLMRISRGNSARPQKKLETLWNASNVLRILGDPGRNWPELEGLIKTQ
jgi:hypothetical protein